MSDETSKSEYDDILSSVRRIVSTELDTAADAATGKLLLTPALRVPDSEGQVAPKATERDYPTLEERIADLEAAVGADPAEWEPDGSEDQTQHRPDGVVLPLRPDAPAEPSDAKVVAEADQVAEPVAEATTQMAEASQEGLSATEAGPAPEPEADLEDAAFDQAMDEVARDGYTPAPANTPEPREPVAPTLATFRHRAPGASDKFETLLSEDEPALLDEMGLRDLVAEIVREELQGGLGERITRNVRKLVRAEIQRAFAARDLD